MTRWLRAHPVGGFVLLAFGISYLVGIPALMLGSGLVPTRWSLAHTYLPRVGVTYGPAIAALVLAWLTRAPDTPRGLLRGALPRWRDLPLAAGILVVGASTSAAALLAAGVAPADLVVAVRDHGGALAAHLVLQVAVIALGEEIGWRGWLLPTLAARTTRLRATLGVGAIWGLWHAPALLQGAARGTMLLVGALGLSILFTALWALADRRAFIAVLAHATVNTPMFFFEQAVGGGGQPDDRLVTAWYYLEAAYAAAAILVIMAGWRWWRSNEPARLPTTAPGPGFVAVSDTVAWKES